MKKITIILIIMILLSFSIIPKNNVVEANAGLGAMTLSGYFAGSGAIGSGVAIATGPLLIGLVAVLAVGGVVSNWDTIEAYGTKVWNDLASKGVNPQSLVNEKSLSVTVTDDLINSAAVQVDSMPKKIAQDFAGWMFAPKSLYELQSSGWSGNSYTIIPNGLPLTYPAGAYKIAIAFDYVVKATSAKSTSPSVKVSTSYGSSSSYSPTFNNIPVVYDKAVSGSISHSFEISHGTSWRFTDLNVYVDNVQFSIGNLRTAVYQDESALSGGYVNSSDTFGTVSSSVPSRVSNAQKVFSKDETITFNERADVAGATMSDLSNISDKILNEETTQTGTLSGIKSGINNLISLISGFLDPIISSIKAVPLAILTGLTGLLTNIYQGVLNLPNVMTNLLEDAGLVWSGMLNALQNLDITFPNSLTDIWTGVLNGVSSIKDTLLDLDFDLSFPDSLTNIWTGVLTGVSSIGNVLADILDWTLSLPKLLLNTITGALTWAFTVPDGYILERTTALDIALSSRFINIPDPKNILSGYDGDMEEWPGLFANFPQYGIGKQQVVNNRSANYYSRQLKMWIGAMLYFLTLLFIIRKMADLLSR